jgi:hypothetical protein
MGTALKSAPGIRGADVGGETLLQLGRCVFLASGGYRRSNFSTERGGAAMTEGTEPEVSQDDPGVMSSEDAPSKEKGTPSISGEDQDQGKTTHPAPESDVGVGDETD